MDKGMRPKPLSIFRPFWTKRWPQWGPRKVTTLTPLVGFYSVPRGPGSPEGVPTPLEQHSQRLSVDLPPVRGCVRRIQARAQK